MQKPLAAKVQETVRYLRALWPRLDGKHRFVAFSTGKDSLALTAMLYEAVESERPICLYSHHGLEFPSNLDYLEELKERGFAVSTVNPFLGYFDLMERGVERKMKRFFDWLSEKDRRRYAAVEATKLGHGGIEYIARVLQCDPKTIRQGLTELEEPEDLAAGRIRKKGVDANR